MKKSRVEASEVGVLTPKQGAWMLGAAMDEAAKKKGQDLRAFLALGYFGGVRTAELERLRWSDVGQEHVRVSASAAKKRVSRLVPISPTLRLWLDLVQDRDGLVVGMGESTRRRSLGKLRKAAGLGPLPKNSARHSFGSFRYAASGFAGDQTAGELGHGGQDMLHRHYNATVEPKDAAEWFALTPDEVGRQWEARKEELKCGGSVGEM